MRYAAILTILFAAFLSLGCIGPLQSTGASNLPDYGVYSTRINETGIVGPYELRAAYSRHVFTIWSTNATQLVNTTSFSTEAVRTCAVTSSSGGAAGEVDTKYNDTTLTGANASRSVFSLTSPERNTTTNNLTVDYQNISGETITVSVNGVVVGTLNQSVAQKNFTLNGSNLVYGTNTVSFSNNVTNTSNHKTNVTNITISYLNATFNCSNAALFETADVLGQLNVSITNSTLNNSTTFELDVYGGDLEVVTNTNSTYIGVYSKLAGGICDPLGFAYPLKWNATGWTNITGLSSSTYASGGVVKLCTVRKQSGSVRNYGALITTVAVQGNYTYNFTGGSVGNVTFQTSLDNRNWFTDATVSNVGAAVRTQTNQTALYARFNVTGLTLTDPSQDAIYIQYVAVSN